MDDDLDKVDGLPMKAEAKAPPSERRAGSWWSNLPSRVKESPLVSLLVLLGTSVVAFATFSDSAANLFRSMREISAPDMSGFWTTPTLTNPYDKNDLYRLEFSFRTVAGGLSGVVTEVEESGFRKDRRSDYPIVGGKADHDTLSFHTGFQTYGDPSDDDKPGEEDKPHNHSEFYEGKMSQGAIEMRRWNDVEPSATEIENFIAKRPIK